MAEVIITLPANMRHTITVWNSWGRVVAAGASIIAAMDMRKDITEAATAKDAQAIGLKTDVATLASVTMTIAGDAPTTSSTTAGIPKKGSADKYPGSK